MADYNEKDAMQPTSCATSADAEIIFNDADFNSASELWLLIDRWAFASPGDNSSDTADDIDSHIKNLILKYAAIVPQVVQAPIVATVPSEQKPVAWVRLRSDGGYEGPLMDSSRDMCDIRRRSGAWTPLYAAPSPTEQASDVRNANNDLLTYVLQDDVHNRLTPRVIDIAYTAFMCAKRTNDEDGGASDWFTDTKPVVLRAIEKLRKDLSVPAAKGNAPDEVKS